MKDDSKLRAARKAIEFIENGQVVGLGTGSTAMFAIKGLSERVQQGLTITGVATSIATERMARELGIPLADLNDVEKIDVTIDGADEIDESFHMIKGGGGALTREKLVALASEKRVIIVDETKLVMRLGERRSLPVEVLPFAWRLSARLLSGLSCKPALRGGEGSPLVTDNGNFILDCEFVGITDPPALEKRIKLVPGVVECGLFISMADIVVIGYEDRVEVRRRPT